MLTEDSQAEETEFLLKAKGSSADSHSPQPLHESSQARGERACGAGLREDESAFSSKPGGSSLKVEILTVIWAVGTASLLLLNGVLARKFREGWVVNVGYLFLFSAIFWAIQAVFVAEVALETRRSPDRSFLDGVVAFLKARWSQL